MIEYKAKNYKFLWQFLNKHARALKAYILGYRSYTALLTQRGTDAPVAQVLDNTLNIQLTFIYLEPGVYGGVVNKSIFNSPNEYITITMDYKKDSITSAVVVIQARPVLSYAFILESWDGGSTADDLIGAILVGGYPCVLEIRKYS